MKKSVGSLQTGGNPKRKRVEHDYYATPPDVVQSFLEVYSGLEKAKTILEPACGGGNISKVLKSNYPQAKIISTDLIDRGFGKGGIDFIKDKTPKVEWVVTNPPFSLSYEFITKSLKVATKGVALFTKIQILETAKRSKLLGETHLKYIYVYGKRQTTWRNGDPKDKGGKAICFCWAIWEKGYKGEPIIRWI